jgi:nucleoside-diphosphate-sugar epimerase
MHIILTGSRGFIGRHLVKILNKRNVESTQVLFDEDSTELEIYPSISLAAFLKSPGRCCRFS